VSAPIRRIAATPLRRDADRSHHTAYGIHSSAPKSTKEIELPFSEPAVVVTSANTAGQRHASPRSELRAARINQGSALNGSSSADCPVMWPTTNGERLYTSAPTVAAARSCHRTRNSTYAPAAAAKRIDPNQHRCATHAGTPRTSVSQ
jgi:hypothetical protein